MRNFVIKILVNAIGLYVAALILKPRVAFAGHGFQLVETILIVALIFGVVNTLIKPIVKLLSLPARMLTLGLFTFVINALMLWLTSRISAHFAVQFQVKGFVAALLGSLVISIVALVLHRVLPEK